MTFFQLVIALFPPALILAAVFRSGDKRDKQLERVNDSIQELVEKVGAQNGRIGKLEERHRLEDSGWIRPE